MPPWEVALSKKAERELRRLPGAIRRRMLDAFVRLQTRGPKPGAGLDIQHLTDRGNAWRLRVSDYRVLFAIEGKTIIVTTIRKRSKGYRR